MIAHKRELLKTQNYDSSRCISKNQNKHATIRIFTKPFGKKKQPQRQNSI